MVNVGNLELQKLLNLISHMLNTCDLVSRQIMILGLEQGFFK